MLKRDLSLTRQLLSQHHSQLMPKKRSSTWSDLRAVTAKLPYPIDQEEVRASLRRAGAHRRLIKDFAARAQVLTKSTRCNVKYPDVCETAFPFLRDRFRSYSMMRGPDWNHSFEVMCEAGDHAIRIVLSQRIRGKSHVVLYASKTLGQVQRNYDATKKDILQELKVLEYTNRAAIKYLPSREKSNPQLIRWLLFLQEFEWEAVDWNKCENTEANH
ncbi:uncharacterized protein LOC121786745 [Salvia splendens]|uniref:uncharacterized protein LOC121786745 n=1 Tax=Salvia splendens TaxID=180675 RepID=UPI001C25A99D|nr:uncharacterized protein LOC121786745 [Salvia splendens]